MDKASARNAVKINFLLLTTVIVALETREIREKSSLDSDSINLTFERTNGTDLSFKGVKLRTGRHRIHSYPAMMHPSVAGFLIDEYANEGDVIFDPFCGSGTVLLAAGQRGHKSIGFDINPLALLIAKAKTARYKESTLRREIDRFRLDIASTKKVDIPSIRNMAYWYADSVVAELGRIRHALLTNAYTHASLFTVCFAWICRNSSYTKRQEFKRMREKGSVAERKPGPVVHNLFQHIESVLPEFVAKDSNPVYPRIYLQNSENFLNRNVACELVITSPPYGDHSTTVAYGQFSSFGNEWTRGINPFNTIDYSVDREGLGKRKTVTIDLDEYSILRATVGHIQTVRPDRAKDVVLFFDGYRNVLHNIAERLLPKGTICLVVGNRTVAGIQIPLDQITAELCQSFGLDFVAILNRQITNKVMPLANSPSNKVGRRSKTMTEEHIVIFRKN